MIPSRSATAAICPVTEPMYYPARDGHVRGDHTWGLHLPQVFDACFAGSAYDVFAIGVEFGFVDMAMCIYHFLLNFGGP